MVSVAQQLRLSQSQRCPLSRAVCRNVVGLPALHFAKRTMKTSAVFGNNAESFNAAHSHSSIHKLSQDASVSGGFKQEVVEALHMTTPANIMYTTQTRYTSFDRPALGPGQALGFVLAAAGVYVAMLISAFFYGKKENKADWKRKKFQERAAAFKAFTSKPRVMAGSRVLSKRPYVQHVLQVSNLLLQSDPPSKLKRYPARVQFLTAV